MNCGFMIKFIYEKYLNLLWILLCMIGYICKSLRIISLVWPIRLIFLAMGEVLSFGFNLVVSFPSDSRGSKARIVLLPSRIKRWGLYHIVWVYPSTYVLPNALLCSYELNTLDACWIAVDVWSNSSRCRIVSVYLSRMWCLYTWSYLDILITMLNSINCSTVIRLPTVILMLSWEKPLVKPMAPGSIFHHINLPTLSYFYCRLFYFAYLFLFIIKIPKILSYHIYQISLS